MAQPLYLECVIAVASTSDAHFHVPITNYTPIDSSQSKREIVSLLKQEPLDPGQMVPVGTLENLARDVLAAAGEPEERLCELERLEIRVATFAPPRPPRTGAPGIVACIMQLVAQERVTEDGREADDVESH